MITRIKTSSNVKEKIEEMQRSLKFPTNATLARIAIGLSLKDKTLPDNDIVRDSHGLEISRYSLTGEDDAIYRALVIQHANKHYNDDEYFSKLLNAHIERGVNLLYTEFKFLGNRDKLLAFLLEVKQ